MNIAARKIVDLRPDLNNIDADRMLIEQTASYVKNLWQQVNAAEMYAAAGREFKKLHGHLSKTKARDKNRIGWKMAFSEQENKFGLSRRTAENYIEIYDAFFHSGNVLPLWKLPQSMRALHLLARHKLTTDQIQACVGEGSLKHDSTEADVRRMIGKLQLAAPKKKTKTRQPVPSMPSKSAPKKQRVEAALELLARLGLTVSDLKDAGR